MLQHHEICVYGSWSVWLLRSNWNLKLVKNFVTKAWKRAWMSTNDIPVQVWTSRPLHEIPFNKSKELFWSYAHKYIAHESCFRCYIGDIKWWCNMWLLLQNQCSISLSTSTIQGPVLRLFNAPLNLIKLNLVWYPA